MRLAIDRRIAELRGRLSVLGAALQNVSPLGTLERGYAIVTDTESGTVLDDIEKITIGQSVTARLARGSFEATVRKKS